MGCENIPEYFFNDYEFRRHYKKDESGIGLTIRILLEHIKEPNKVLEIVNRLERLCDDPLYLYRLAVILEARVGRNARVLYSDEKIIIYKKAIELLERIPEEFKDTHTKIRDFQISIYKKLSVWDHDNEIEYFTRILEIAKRLLKLGKIKSLHYYYIERGEAYKRKKEYTKALEDYKKAVEIIKNFIKENPRDAYRILELCEAYGRIESVYKLMGKKDKALELYKERKRLFEEVVLGEYENIDNGLYLQCLRDTYIGEYMYEQIKKEKPCNERIKPLLKAVDAMIALRRKVNKFRLDSLNALPNFISYNLIQLAEECLNKDDYDSAIEALSKAIELIDNRPSLIKLIFYPLFNNYIRAGRMLSVIYILIKGDYRKAIDVLKRLEERILGAIGSDKVRIDKKVFLRCLITIYFRLGVAYYKLRDEKYKAFINKFYELYRELYK